MVVEKKPAKAKAETKEIRAIFLTVKMTPPPWLKIVQELSEKYPRECSESVSFG
jgi:hypothetical protein